MNTAIEFRNISKRYYIGQKSIRSLHEDLEDFAMKLLGRKSKKRKIIWAVKDANFMISQGESVGLVGSNGSGKTTIFKLIARITTPTSGNIFVNGRVGSLIDLQAGFHPELTGIENIYLSAALRGMKRKDIKKSIDEILDFAEVERFKDTPVKHYSAGMKIRLGFSIAIKCPNNILLIDEVISVGDFRFKQKSLERIAQLKNEGRTILFISHELDKVKQVCSRVMYVSNGRIVLDGDASETIDKYIQGSV